MELSKAQDIEAGDGTTSVVVLAGSLLGACERLLEKGINASVIAESFQKAAAKACEILEKVIELFVCDFHLLFEGRYSSGVDRQRTVDEERVDGTKFQSQSTC